MRIGGLANEIAEVKSEQDVIEVYEYAKETICQ